ncbi:HECT-domain (ubiquitin-transferase) family protein [Leishmania donovani]|uniref:HECT-type E3 ubiquitin transferase n=1 Tax=Leishmania donovani TaxID=5661 RepID=A0A504X931_LEIDO|nr:HECT-domain (ubiquitin-transferase) family protein [Leishmania donovani]
MDGFRFYMEGIGLPEGNTRRANAELIGAINSPDPTVQHSGLQMLCDQLTMSSFISPSTMATIPLVLPSLLRCIASSQVREVFITAARALTYIIDAFPRTFETFPTRHTLIEVLLQHLRSIQDVELSEQCITCLEMITRSQMGSRELLHNDGVEAVLGFADFFTLHKQRQIWTIVQRLVGEVDESSVRHITACLPTLRIGMTNGDSEIRQKAIATLAQAIEGVKTDRATVETVFGDAADRIAVLLHERDVNDDTLSSALSLLFAGVQWSAGIAASVIQSDLFNTLLSLLQPAPVPAVVAEQHAAPSAAGRVARRSAAAELVVRRDSGMDSGGGAGTEPAAARTTMLTSHQRTIVCRLLASLLIPCRTGATEQLERLEMLTQRPLLTGAMAHGNRVAQEQGLKIETKAAYARCRASGFMCDGCGKNCTPGDWYRCNECPDKDYCTACVLEHYKDDHGGQHSYTDMEQVVGAAARNRDKLELYRKSPQLLQRVLEAIPTVVCVCVSSELVAVRTSCLDFLVSAVDMASTEQLLASDITKVSLGESLNNNLRGADLVCNALAVALAGRLLQKLSGIYQVQFAREGVKLSLQVLKQRCKVKGRTTLTREARTALTTCTAGWSTIIGTEASILLQRFLDVEDEQATEPLRRVVEELRQDHFSIAIGLLRDVLAGDVTAFEFFSSGVVRELRNCLSRQQNIYAVMHLVAALSTSPAATRGGKAKKSAGVAPTLAATTAGRVGQGSGSLLSHFVHHLHTILTLLDDFTVPTYDFIGGVHNYFVVSFEPHRASVAVAGDTTADTSTPSARGDGDSSISPRQCIKARIRPISSVSAMAQVLQQEVLQQESEDGDNGDGEEGEAVTNVLPDLHPRHSPMSRDAETPMPAAPSSPASAPANSNVWIRYGTHVLPLSMTMLQIMEHLVLPAAAASENEARGSHRDNAERRAKPRHQRRGKPHDTTAPEEGAHEEEEVRHGAHSRLVPLDTSTAAGYSLQRPVVLYYSTTPYNPQYYSLYKVPNAFPASGNPQAPLQVRLPSQDRKPSAVRDVQEQLAGAFHYSKHVLSDSQRDVLGLLGTLHAAVANWAVLLNYVRTQAAAESKHLRGVDVACILNTFAPAISIAEFQHAKLNSKAIQQCSQMLLAGQQRGTWAVKLALDCTYLFSYSTRKFLFDVGFTSTDRCLIQMRKYRELFGLNEPRMSSEQMRGIYGQLKKETKRVWREDVLECAKKVLSAQDARARNLVWSFHFYNENGWGDGPTREFYTLVSQELRQRKLGLWRDGNEAADDNEYNTAAYGLFPKPVLPGSAQEKDHLVPFFRLIGRFIGRALVDEHVPGLPLSPVFLRLLRGDVCGIHDVQDLSEEVGRLLVAMAGAAASGHTRVQLPGQTKAVEVQDLALDFTLPGDDSVELCADGAKTAVTANNMMAYCDAVTSFLLDRGVAAAVHALREGFHWYIPLVALQMLSVDELYQLIAGHETAITRDDFEKYSEANYGYTLNCKHVQWLFDILAAFTVEEQKQFFFFLTGSAHLPVGGLGRLRPSFTIVRKTSEDASIKEEDMLPSAMTCQNYLKLPQYNTKEEMEKKLRFAMTEGSGVFLLS